jgi:hypothetical protein
VIGTTAVQQESRRHVASTQSIKEVVVSRSASVNDRSAATTVVPLERVALRTYTYSADGRMELAHATPGFYAYPNPLSDILLSTFVPRA